MVASCATLGNPKYGMYCTHCFANLFPDDPRTAGIRSKSKETKWVNALLQSAVLADYDWTWDKPIYVTYDGGCCDSKRRIDLWAIVGNVVFAIEIDENQHKPYVRRDPDYEANRYNELVMDFTGRFVFLRINPDPYKVAGVKQDPGFDDRLSLVEDKIAELLTDVESGIEDDSQDMVQVHHMFYDE